MRDKIGDDLYKNFMKLLNRYATEKNKYDMDKLSIAVDQPPMGFIDGKPSYEFVSRYIPEVGGKNA